MSIVVNNPIIIQNTQKKVLALPRNKLIARSVLISALKTHPSLTVEDIRWFLNQVQQLNNRELTELILRIYKLSNVGRFSFIYNQDLDSHIKDRNAQRVQTLIRVAGKECAWPEVYNNILLNSEERQTIEKMANREYFSILNTLETAQPSDDLDNIIPCTVSTDEIIGLSQNATIYSQCYDNVCIAESQQSGKIISFSNAIPQVAYVADQTERYCFPLMEIIQQLAQQNYINPQTNQRFADITLKQLLTKYEKEIKMYKYYLETLKEHNLNPID